MSLPFIHDRSFGILPVVDIKTITPATTLMTAGGGEPNDFNSVKFPLFRVFKAC